MRSTRMFFAVMLSVVASHLCVMPAVLAQGSTGRLVVTSERANVRQGPSNSFSVVATVRQGEAVSRLDQQGNWYKVELVNGTVGWVYRTLVSQYEDPPATSRERVSQAAPPQVASRTIKVESIPTGATIFVNGVQETLATPHTLVVPPGNYQVKVVLEGYELTEADVVARPNTEVPILVTLGKLRPGSLKVNTAPTGAAVDLNGQRKGVTPLFIHNVPAGNHRVRLISEGYLPKEVEMLVPPGGHANVSETLAVLPDRISEFQEKELSWESFTSLIAQRPGLILSGGLPLFLVSLHWTIKKLKRRNSFDQLQIKLSKADALLSDALRIR